MSDTEERVRSLLLDLANFDAEIRRDRDVRAQLVAQLEALLPSGNASLNALARELVAGKSLSAARDAARMLQLRRAAQREARELTPHSESVTAAQQLDADQVLTLAREKIRMSVELQNLAEASGYTAALKEAGRRVVKDLEGTALPSQLVLYTEAFNRARAALEAKRGPGSAGPTPASPASRREDVPAHRRIALSRDEWITPAEYPHLFPASAR